MKNILQVINNQATISTLIIAEHTNNQHKNIKELIRDNLIDFNELGIMDLKHIGRKGQKGYATYYNLNEQQYSLLMTYLRNNEKVKEFKKNMVKAFFMMRQKIEHDGKNFKCIINGYKSQIKQLQNKLANQKLLPHKTFDDKLDDMVNQIDRILKTNPNSFGYMQERAKYLSNYIKHLKSNGTEQQRFMISEIDRYKQQFIVESNKRNQTQHKLDRLKNTIDQYVQVSNQMLKYRYEE